MSDGKGAAARVEVWVWVLIYGGLFLLAIGVALARAGKPYAWGVIIAGCIVAIAGAALVWVRSRMADGPRT